MIDTALLVPETFKSSKPSINTENICEGVFILDKVQTTTIEQVESNEESGIQSQACFALDQEVYDAVASLSEVDKGRDAKFDNTVTFNCE